MESLKVITKEVRKAIKDTHGEIYVVGGFVRDWFLDQPSKDIDIVIQGIPYSKLKSLLSNFGQLDEVGKSFGVIKWVPKGQVEVIDVALPRVEVSTGEGHKDFDIHFNHMLPIEEDLKRRDFTMNAMALKLNIDNSFQLIDPYEWSKNLKEICCVSKESFQDDPLRMLRAIQFIARFGLSSNKIKLDITTNAFRIKYISPDRIGIELGKLFSKGKNLDDALTLMSQSKLWDRIFSEISIPFNQMNFIDKDINLRLATLFSFGGLKSPRSRLEVAEETFDELKLSVSGADKKKVLLLIKLSEPEFYNKLKFQFDEINSFRRFLAYELNGDIEMFISLSKFWMLRAESNLEMALSIINKLDFAYQINKNNDPLRIKDLAINGNDLIKSFNYKGKAIGMVLKVMLDIVLDDPSLNTKKDLLFFAESYSNE